MNKTKNITNQKSINHFNPQLIENRKFIGEEFLRFIFSIIGSLLLYLIVAFCIIKIYHPDTEAMIKKGLEISIVTDFNPEPVEALLYRMAILIFPLSLCFFYWLLSLPLFQRGIHKISDQKAVVPVISLCAAAGIAFLGYYVFSQPNPTFIELTNGKVFNEHDKVSNTNFTFYFTKLFFDGNLLQYTLCYIPLLFGLFVFLFSRFKDKTFKYYNIITSCVGCVITIIILFQLFKINHFDMPLNWQNQYDFNAVYYSMTQVNAGSQMLVDGFSNTYGLYPHFLSPLFSIIGLSVNNFTFVMSLLIVFCFLSSLFFLWTFSKDKLLMFLFFISLFILPYFQIRFVTDPDSVFAMFPIRMLCPALLFDAVSLLSIAQKQGKPIFKKIVYFVSMFVLAFGILWNFEFGLVSFIAWIIFLCYSDFFNEQKTINIKKIGIHCIIGILSVMVAFGLYTIIQLIQYGNVPEFSLMLNTLTIFSKYGFFMLPMKMWHPWLLIVIVFIIGLTYSIAHLIKKDITTKSAAILLASVIGTGLFAYYQGRSHNSNLASTFFFSFIALALLTDKLWENYKHSRSTTLLPFFFLALYCCTFSTIDVAANSVKISNMASHHPENKQLRATMKQEKQKIQKNINFIDSCEQTTNKILLFTSNKYQGLYMSNPKMRSAVNPGILDMFYKTDVEKYIQTIEDSSFNIYLDPYGFYYSSYKNIKAAIAQNYEVIKYRTDSTSISFSLLKKREISMPSKSFFYQNANTVVYHQKFSADSTGNVLRRKASTEGLDKINIPNNFTVEVLFYPDSLQAYLGASIISNSTDSSGFQISRNGDCKDKDSYFIGLSNIGFTTKLKPNQWHYLVMIVMGDIVTLYDNGNQVGICAFGKPYNDKGTSNLFIGNQTGERYFMGLISEVSISKGSIPIASINETLKKINQECKLK